MIWAESIVIVISDCSLFFIYHNNFEKVAQTNHQNIIHQTSIDINVHIHDKNISGFIWVHSRTTHKTTKNKATAVQSLNKLSHSKIRANLLGAHILLNIAKTATGSVADIKAQNNKKTKNGTWKPAKEKIKYIKDATIIADMIKPTIDNQLMIFQSFTKYL